MALKLYDGRFHGILPVTIFLKIWGGVGENLNIHPQKVQDLTVKNSDSVIREDRVAPGHIHLTKEPDEYREIIEDIT